MEGVLGPKERSKRACGKQLPDQINIESIILTDSHGKDSCVLVLVFNSCE